MKKSLDEDNRLGNRFLLLKRTDHNLRADTGVGVCIMLSYFACPM